jgi:pSer/pThr/pTyr-binding forkhead associated (FHA) protein
MSDPRLNSGHLGLTRREQYRHARSELMGARGLLTLAAERVEDWVGKSADWPSLLPIRPSQLLPGFRLALIEPQTGSSYPLRTGFNTIGRFPENDIVFEEIEVSRRHCVILVHVRGNCELHDTASINGTFLNGERVRLPVPLARCDQIRICNHVLLLAGARDDEQDLDNGFPPTALV